jgi:gamma-glutamyl hercynylcysteine S-oxide synthase
LGQASVFQSRSDDDQSSSLVESSGRLSSIPGEFSAKPIYPISSRARDARGFNKLELAQALTQVREHTLHIFDAMQQADLLTVPQRDEFNPPLWELGHIAWFQNWWIARYAIAERAKGLGCTADSARAPCTFARSNFNSDALYDSARVEHSTRWQLPLLDASAIKDYMAHGLAQTLSLLGQADNDHDALYLYRLVLFHEAMHVEAAYMMAQAMAHIAQRPVDLTLAAIANDSTMQIEVPAQTWQLGSQHDAGFCFDNELKGDSVLLDAFSIDTQPVTWAQYIAFVEATKRPLPRFVRRRLNGGEYEVSVFGRWLTLDAAAPAVHLMWQDAHDYCTWAGRALPTEAQWECTALTRPELDWGQVWEWTASAFAPYGGFAAHPYRDYSAPWFSPDRKVLRGGSTAALPIMKHERYRNYFTTDRDDVYAGFRTVSL